MAMSTPALFMLSIRASQSSMFGTGVMNGEPSRWISAHAARHGLDRVARLAVFFEQRKPLLAQHVGVYVDDR